MAELFHKKLAVSFIIAVTPLLFISCSKLNEILPTTLSESEIAEGLKEALSVGTDSTVKKLIQPDAYFTDAAIKILLPPEVQQLTVTLKNAVGESTYNTAVQPYVNDLVKSINHSAEDAAQKAAPIFKSAITDMTISDASSILKGSDTSATNYLRVKTFSSLTNAYAPKIDSSLNKPLLFNKSTNDYWSSFVSAYNTAADVYNLTTVISGNTPVVKIQNQSLGTYTTQKALTGLFIKIKDEEAAIRTNPLKRVTDILKKVFGS